MLVKDLKNINCLHLKTSNVNLESEIKDLYTCDLLSWVMGHVHEDKVVLLTVLNSMNAVAVATLLDMSAIIFTDGVIPTDDIVARANTEHIEVFYSDLNSIDTAREIMKYENLL